MPEAIVLKRKDDCMSKVLKNASLKIEDLNRMNDAFAKYIFANEKRKQLTLGLVNSFFEFEGTADIKDFEFVDRELDPDREKGKGVVLDVVGKSSDGTLACVFIFKDYYGGKEAACHGRRRYSYCDGSGKGINKRSSLHYRL